MMAAHEAGEDRELDGHAGILPDLAVVAVELRLLGFGELVHSEYVGLDAHGTALLLRGKPECPSFILEKPAKVKKQAR